jgi:eukaryotic-like serine/threonine-protein kinase
VNTSEHEPRDSLAAGVILQSRYQVVRMLGWGGMGAVYEAVDKRLGRTVALKKTLVETEELRRAFEREDSLLANLNHPLIPRVTDHFEEGQELYLVMDYVPGEDLKAQLARRGTPFSVDDVKKWAADLLEALDYLHSRNPPVLHRDIKPANVKLSERGRVVLLDFGLAKGTAGYMTAATLSRSLHGYSPHFASLEQIQGERTTVRSDLYSMGGITPRFSGRAGPPLIKGSLIRGPLQPLVRRRVGATETAPD